MSGVSEGPFGLVTAFRQAAIPSELRSRWAIAAIGPRYQALVRWLGRCGRRSPPPALPEREPTPSIAQPPQLLRAAPVGD